MRISSPQVQEDIADVLDPRQRLGHVRAARLRHPVDAERPERLLLHQAMRGQGLCHLPHADEEPRGGAQPHRAGRGGP